jgi:ABC-type transporter MlaC component
MQSLAIVAALVLLSWPTTSQAEDQSVTPAEEATAAPAAGDGTAAVRAVVKTEFVQPKDKNVQFDYRLRKVEGRWRIIDIAVTIDH